MNSCGCSINGGFNDDLWEETFVEKYISAQRNYRCAECERIIPAGEKFMHFSGCWNGGARHFNRVCNDCMSVITAYVCEWPLGGLWEYSIEAHLEDSGGDDLADSRMAKLTPRGREMLCECFEKYWEKLPESPEILELLGNPEQLED